MKQIIFPGSYRQPSEAHYEIIFEDGDVLARKVNIVVVQTHGVNSTTSLINSDEGRNIILNRILSHDLNGVRVEFVTFSLIYYVSDNDKHGFRFPIRLDMDDYVKRGNPHDVADVPSSDLRSALLNLIGKGGKQYSVWTYNIVGGCARFFQEFEEREHLSGSEVDRLLAAVKYK